MHEYDPNGSLREYRRQRDRREMLYTILAAAGSVIVLLSIFAATTLLISVVSQP